MAMQVDHSYGGSGVVNFVELEPPEPEFAAPAPAPVAAPPAPSAAPAPSPIPPAPAPSNWVAELPPTAFGPPSPHPGQTPAPTVLATLAPAPAVAVIEAAATVVSVATPASSPAVAATPAAPTAPALEIATLELTLADPLTQELIQHHGGELPVLDLSNLNPVQQEQVDRYGASLTARLMQLAQANAAVRDLYLQAMQQAAQDVGPDTVGAVFVPGTQGNRGDSVPDSWRFDPVAFTQAYAQTGLNDAAPVEQRAFAAFYGPDALQAWEQVQGGDSESVTRGYTLGGSFELRVPPLTDWEGSVVQAQMNWAGAILESDSHGVYTLSMQAPPELHNAQAVWFDATLGWVTPTENMVVKQSALDKVAPIVFIGVMTWATAGALGIAGGAGVATGAGIGASGGIVGAMTAGAAFGAIGGFYSGLVFEGRIDLRGMFRGALTGAITAGISHAANLNTIGLNKAGEVSNYAHRALAVTGQATLQGALQEISGGNFRDGFTAGLAQGLGAEIARGLNLQIDQLTRGDNPSIDAAQAGALRQFARVAQSAVSILANPDDPGHAFASTFVSGLVSDVQQGLTAHDAQTVSPAWASAPDETAAETARLGRQGTAPGTDAGYRNGSDIDSDNAYQARHDTEWAAQNDEILARRGDDAAAANPQPDAGTPVSSPSATSNAEASSSPATQIVVITGNRPEGTAVEVTLPAGVDAAADITRNGTPTELLSGSAATAALALLGVPATAVEAAATAGGRLMLYAGERAVGMMVPGVGLLLGASTAAYYVIQSGSQHAPGDAFKGVDGSLHRYAPASDGGLVLQSWSPQAAGSPEEVEGTWTTVGRFVPLSDEERAEMLRPTTTPAQPRGPQNPPPLPASHEPSQPLPGYTSQGVQQPTVIGTPAVAQDWHEYIINAEGERVFVPSRTEPAGSLGSVATGDPTPNDEHASPRSKADIAAENKALDDISTAGYRTERNPILTAQERDAQGLSPRSNPDARIEGKVFDVKASYTPGAAQSAIRDSVESRQSRRFIISTENFSNPEEGARELSARLRDHPLPGLQEVKVIVNGVVRNIYP